MRLGIETEFLIAAIKQPDSLREDFSEFVKDLAKKHNSDVDPSHPRMLEHLRGPNEQADFTRWAMTLDETVTRRSWKSCKQFPIDIFISQKRYEYLRANTVLSVGLEMVTPILDASAGSRWRDDVQATWRYVRKHYQITADSTCSTHVHVSLVSGYTTNQLKRIASSVIHFETAFEALVPETRRANIHVKSNWLHSGSLARQGLSRSKSIAAIENARTTPDVVRLMQLRGQQGFAWNFRSLYFKRTIEFRKPPASVTADEALSWAELAMTFVQAAILHGSSAELSTYPAHVTGLNSFLKNVCVAGVNEPGRWYKLWNLKPVDAALEPVPNLLVHNKEVAARLNSLLSADKRLIEKQGGQFTNRGKCVAIPYVPEPDFRASSPA
jgi:Putative amidoligase enzyme